LGKIDINFMQFDIFSLHPDIFTSFLSESLIARAISKEIIQVKNHNFRDFGIGNYKAVDDRPFGGGSGMVLRPEPIYHSLLQANLVSKLFSPSQDLHLHNRTEPQNHIFEQKYKSGELKPSFSPKSATIMLTPRGYPLTQQISEWLASDFDQIGLVCGRYEGFDARVSEMVDLEISLGDFVLNGGEVAAMALVESISRLLPDFITKENSVLHDSFSSRLNDYAELEEFIIGKTVFSSLNKSTLNPSTNSSKVLFNSRLWLEHIAPKVEHPQYTRPETFENWQVPDILLSGDHKKIDQWRKSGWRKELYPKPLERG
jgi:tRNA (guanine37-N1)-methyltransferase